MRVLVTGGAGFIGARVVRQLLARDHTVAVLVRSDREPERLADIKARIRLFVGHLGNADSVRPHVEEFRPEVAIHLAWYAEPSRYLYAEENLQSLAGSIALTKTLLRTGCRHLVMAGTCAEYDVARGWLREDGPTGPTTLYAASKLAMCMLGQQLAAAESARFAWGRIFYLYGPGEDPRRVVPALMRTILSGGTFGASEGSQIRDYSHADDVASGFVALAEKDAHGVYNISSGRPLAMRDIVRMAAEAAGGRERVQFGTAASRKWEPPMICGDNGRLRALGWAPSYTLETGLAEMVEYWRMQLDRTSQP